MNSDYEQYFKKVLSFVEPLKQQWDEIKTADGKQTMKEWLIANEKSITVPAFSKTFPSVVNDIVSRWPEMTYADAHNIVLSLLNSANGRSVFGDRIQ